MKAFARILLCAIFLTLLMSAPKTASAGWQTTGDRGCGTNCSSPKEVCDYWATVSEGTCIYLGPPFLTTYNGKFFGMTYRFLIPATGTIVRGATSISCKAPLRIDPLIPGACSLAASPPEKQMGKGCPGQCTAGNPISINTGNKYETAVDFTTEGQSPLTFVRYYNSLTTQFSTLGWGWRSNFDRGVRYNGTSMSNSSQIWFTRPDGASWQFLSSGSSWRSADKDVNATLTSQGATGWTLSDANDNVEFYNANGSLISITDPSGYTQNLSYDTNGNLTAVADSFGRTLTFTYVDKTIHTMTDPDGNVYTYNYVNLILGNDKLVSVTFPGSDSPPLQYLYENSTYPYALTGVVDENGQRLASWDYDSALRAVSSRHGTGADLTTLSYSLDTNGIGTVTSTNALGKQNVYTLSLIAGVGKITKISGLATSHTPATSETFTYDNNGYTASHTDRNGNVTKYTNDARGNILSEIDGFGSSVSRTVTTTWDPVRNIPTKIVQPGLTTDYVYSAGLLISKKQTDTTSSTVPYSTNGTTRTWTYGYYPTGLLQSVNGPGGASDVVTYTYDAHGCVASFTNQLGQVSTVSSVNGRCQPLSSLDANGVATAYTYDSRGRVTSIVVNPGSSQSATEYSYDLAGNLTSTIFPDGSSLTYRYDDAHRLTGLANNLGETISYTLDALGNTTETDVRSASSVVTKRQAATFDELGRVIANIGAASQTTLHAYDANDNEIATTDPRGKVYGHTFDALNRLYQDIDPVGAKTTTVFNGKDEVTSVVDARSLKTSFVRDGFGDVIQRTSPDTGTEVYWYDGNGNVTKKVDARGIQANYTYNSANYLLTATFPSAPTENVAYTYNETAGGNYGIGRITSVADQSGSSSLVYDAQGRIETDTHIIAGQSYTTKYTYNAVGSIATEVYPSGRVVQYSRDSTGRISGISMQSSASAPSVALASNVAYKPFGQVFEMSFGNGLSNSMALDEDYRITGIRVSGSSASIIDQTNTLDQSGNLTAITDNLNSSASQALSYDDVNRLIGSTGAYGNQAYTYDSVGNRLTRSSNAVTESYSYSPASNKLISVSTTGGGTRTLTYAETGQLTQDARDAGNVLNFGVNARGRNSSSSLNGTVVGTYLYNAWGQRAQKSAGGLTTQFIYDRAGHLLAEADGTGTPLRDYVWLDDLPVAIIDATSGSQTVYFIHTDQLSTPQRITDSSGSVVWANNSDPFGKPMTDQGRQSGVGVSSVASVVLTPPLTNSLRFSGQYFDSETGLAQNWFRDYDSSTGRYIQSDTIGLKGGVNTYAYVGGNPSRFTDPTGLCPWCVVWGLIELGLIANEVATADVPMIGGGLGGAASRAVEQSLTREAAQSCTVPAKGGVYLLLDKEGKVVRTGRSNDLARREAEHARDPSLGAYTFDVYARTDAYAEQRGLEQMIHSEYSPILNKIAPISDRNVNFDAYMEAAANYLRRLGR